MQFKALYKRLKNMQLRKNEVSDKSLKNAYHVGSSIRSPKNILKLGKSFKTLNAFFNTFKTAFRKIDQNIHCSSIHYTKEEAHTKPRFKRKLRG